MAIVLLRFVINLKDHRDTGFFGGNGPLFHRWLPNGEKDAIMLETGDENVELKIWFERLGYLDGSFIKFDKMRHEVEPEIMDKQGMLEAGPLQGSLKIGGIADQELQSMRKFKLGVEKYKVFGKKVIKLIYPSV